MVTAFYRDAVTLFLRELKRLGFSGAAVVSAGLFHADKYVLGIGGMFQPFSRNESDRSHLILPDAWIESIDAIEHIDEIVQPMMDVLWQSFDVERCLEYDESGKWTPRNN